MPGDQPTVALVSGEPGIGKTRLVLEALAAVPPRVATIGVSAQPGSMGRPLDAVASLGPVGLTGDDLAEAVFTMVAEATARGPTVFIVEDLHWIDAASANVVDRIAQQPWPNLVLVATYRPNDLSRGQPGGELVLRLERRHAVEQIRLERLTRTEVSTMVSAIAAATDSEPSSALVEALYRRSGGIPFVVEELMPRGRAAGHRVRAHGGGVAVVAGGGGAPPVGRAAARPPACDRSARRVRTGGVVRGAAHRDRGRRGGLARRPAGTRRRWRGVRGQR